MKLHTPERIGHLKTFKNFLNSILQVASIQYTVLWPHGSQLSTSIDSVTQESFLSSSTVTCERVDITKHTRNHPTTVWSMVTPLNLSNGSPQWRKQDGTRSDSGFTSTASTSTHRVESATIVNVHSDRRHQSSYATQLSTNNCLRASRLRRAILQILCCTSLFARSGAKLQFIVRNKRKLPHQE